MEHNCGCGCNHNNFEIANLDSKEQDAIKKAEAQVKSETGKDIIMIAWEKK
ncbi:hypothetical protein H8923_06105 [Romboutsia hominis]|uniref:Uncharacterized protein n=1 Tax=Romboutsia faecis TaxID=2764597 RepID=A0ABR7JN48_9FIRM|nr:hypothetical protein [Romboutsia faecis]MBC5996329.1 hypothetical protein [Romboutsia faecis]